MEAAKKYLEKHESYDRVNLKDGLEHTLELINAKIDNIKDKNTQKDIEGVKFLVKEGEELKTIFTTSVALIQKLADIEPKTIITITQVKYFGNNDKELTGYNVTKFVGDKFEKVGEDVEEKSELETIQVGSEEDDISIKDIPF